MWSAGQGDDKERFLADLCALRDTAALGYEELAARAHYPSDILKEAEHGPSLPGLPILAAYVRACDGDVPEWEERWRRLGVEVRADPGLPVRPAGSSPAAVAGARAGVSVAPPDAYDPERIRAALRGSAAQTDNAAAQANAGQPTGEAARWDTSARAGTATAGGGDARSDSGRSGAGASWDVSATRNGDAAWKGDVSWDAASDQGSTTADGNRQAWRQGDVPSGAAVTDTPDPAAAADALRRDPFSSSWLHDSQPIPPVPDTELARQDRAGGGRAAPEDAGQAPPSWRDFWAPAKGTAAAADVQRPSVPPSAEEPTMAGTSWSAFTPSWPKVTADPAQRQAPDVPPRAEPMVAQAATPAPSQAPAEPAVPQPAPGPPGKSRQDRYYPLRLLAVIMVAALIGSILVLVLR